MAAGDEEEEVGEGDVGDEPRRQGVAGEVVDAPERQAAAGGDALGEHHPGEDAADQAGAGGDGDGVEVGEGEAGAVEGGAGDGVEALGVGAGGDLGDDAAVGGVERVLAGDLGGEDVADGPAGASRGRAATAVSSQLVSMPRMTRSSHLALRVARDCVRREPQVPPRPAPRNGGAREARWRTGPCS